LTCAEIESTANAPGGCSDERVVVLTFDDAVRSHATVIAMRDLDKYVKTPVPSDSRIDRRALVGRHNVTITEPDPLTPLSVGNGEFAFTADITGLQTFPEYYQAGMPLGTQSQWGWHTIPAGRQYALSEVLEDYEVWGRNVPYACDGKSPKGYSPAATWLRSNPHRIDLGRISLHLLKTDGSPAKIGDLVDTSQTLDLWSGILDSRFTFDSHPVTVRTVCHPDHDILAVKVISPLIEKGRLTVSLAFPYGSSGWRDSADWSSPNSHTTLARIGNGKADFIRKLDSDGYLVRLLSPTGGEITALSQHEYEIGHGNSNTLEIVFGFSSVKKDEDMPDFDAVKTAVENHWRDFWSNGGAIDFSGCTDSRAFELERRVVLSQYLTAINCSGSYPPQETGLVGNSWYGKFHIEMHWWHGVGFALWDRLDLLEKSLPWYQSILPAAGATARNQGYKGARWPKMTSPDGRESPSNVGVFLIWQQPHPIYYAELCCRKHKDRQTLEKYKDIVFETAEFMASYAAWDNAGQRYVLGPAMIPAQESYGQYRRQNLNPAFELAYWYWGLSTAQQWRQRLGMERNRQWDEVMSKLARPNVREGVYTAVETAPYTIYRDHPSMAAAYGFLPRTPLVEPDIMSRTFADILDKWDWQSTWGWDYPMLAMTAARLGEPEKAVDALFIESPKNRYLANGHNYQSARLPLYLPGNGGLLSAVAMMATGWDGCPDHPAPGFPDDGKWNIRYERLEPMP
jgi:hypothetical protein